MDCYIFTINNHIFNYFTTTKHDAKTDDFEAEKAEGVRKNDE
jgi:hypothetical protein